MADQGPLSGKLLGGRYQLGERLGRGGFADVYLGEHLHLKAPRAIKVLHTQLTGADVAQFRNEARLVAHLDHPHILPIHDFDLEQGLPFLVMDYAPNGSLRQRHPRGERVPLATVVSYVKQIAAALQYAHDQKVIHRDIKPENLLLGRTNDILLSDFGIAVVAQSTSQQRMQEFAGTAAYSAPEQLQGKPHLASDQYALGIVVYEWLTGVVPFRGSYLEVASQHVLTPPPPPRQTLPDLAPAIEQVVLTALSKDPQQRFASVQEFAQTLEQACQRKTLSAATTQVIPPALQPTIRAVSSPIASTERPLHSAAAPGIGQQTGGRKSDPADPAHIGGAHAPRPPGKSEIASGLKTIRRWSIICLITQALLGVVGVVILVLVPGDGVSSDGSNSIQGLALALAPGMVFLFVSTTLLRAYTADYRALLPIGFGLLLWPVGVFMGFMGGLLLFPSHFTVGEDVHLYQGLVFTLPRALFYTLLLSVIPIIVNIIVGCVAVVLGSLLGRRMYRRSARGRA